MWVRNGSLVRSKQSNQHLAKCWRSELRNYVHHGRSESPLRNYLVQIISSIYQHGYMYLPQESLNPALSILNNYQRVTTYQEELIAIPVCSTHTHTHTGLGRKVDWAQNWVRITFVPLYLQLLQEKEDGLHTYPRNLQGMRGGGYHVHT